MTTLSPAALDGRYHDPLTRSLLCARFLRDNYVKLPEFLTESAWTFVREEARAISWAGIARDFLMPGYLTRRKMRGIGGKIVRQCSPRLAALYASAEIRCFLEDVTGSSVYRCRHENEFMVMNIFDRSGATHGWHFDDPAFALVLVLDAPPPSEGGWLEYVDHNVAPDQRAAISKAGGLKVYLRSARSHRAIKRRHHKMGDAYILRADRCLHRVTAVKTSSRRAILNLAYESGVNTRYGDSASILYDMPGTRAA